LETRAAGNVVIVATANKLTKIRWAVKPRIESLASATKKNDRI
jgi:hypothetical protein